MVGGGGARERERERWYCLSKRERVCVWECVRVLVLSVCAFDSPMNQASELEKIKVALLRRSLFPSFPVETMHTSNTKWIHIWCSCPGANTAAALFNSWLSEQKWADTLYMCALSWVHEKSQKKSTPEKQQKCGSKKFIGCTKQNINK